MPAARLLRLVGLRPFRRRPAWRGAASGWGPAAWAGWGLQRGGVSPFARRGPSPSACLMRAGTLSDDGPAVGVFLLRHVRGWRLASRFMRSRRSSSVSRHWRRVFSGVSMPWLAAWWCQRTVWARLEALCHVVEHFVERFGRPLLPVGVVVRRGGQRGVEPVEHGLYGFGVFEEFRDGAGLSFHRAPDEGSHVFVGVELFGVFVHRFGDGPARRHVYDEVFPGGAAGFEPLPAGESGVERPALLIGGGFDGVRVHGVVSFPSWPSDGVCRRTPRLFSVGQRRYAGYRPDAATAATMMARLVSGSSSSAARAARVAAFPSPSHHAR